jgi:hypothetical protein
MQKIGQAVYASAGAGGPGGPADDGQSGPAEEGTVEGEFRDAIAPARSKGSPSGPASA